MSYPSSVVERFLPEFPSTPHLPWKPNASRQDKVARSDEAAVAFGFDSEWTEKIDGANLGVGFLDDGVFRARNRNHILDKAYLKETAAKKQFRPVWNWGYLHRKNFAMLNQRFGYPVSVYGEWCFAVHTIRYTRLPEVFLAFDIYDLDKECWLARHISRPALEDAGFAVVHKLERPADYQAAERLCQSQSQFGDEKREGVYVAVSQDGRIVSRFKMVRSDFIRGEHWSKKQLIPQNAPMQVAA